MKWFRNTQKGDGPPVPSLDHLEIVRFHGQKSSQYLLRRMFSEKFGNAMRIYLYDASLEAAQGEVQK